MSELQIHESQAPIPPYTQLKPEMRKARLFTCSEVGYNYAMGSLVSLRQQLQTWLASLEPGAEQWVVPPLLRADWVPTGVWQYPSDREWCREEPGGHMLTPLPLMYLLTRLKYHPVEQGSWLLSGWSTRNEANTLPLLRQRTFTVYEHVRLGSANETRTWAAQFIEQLWQQAVAWDLPVELLAVGEQLGCEAELTLRMPDTPAALLSRVFALPPQLKQAYQLAQEELVSVASGIERWCLAIIARHGADPASWPSISSA